MIAQLYTQALSLSNQFKFYCMMYLYFCTYIYIYIYIYICKRSFSVLGQYSRCPIKSSSGYIENVVT
jgi:hypothetical protein